MGRPKGSRNRRPEDMQGPPDEAHIEVASIANVEPSDVAKLLDLVEDLRAKLAVAEAGRSIAEQAALEKADSAQRIQQREIEETSTGRTVQVRKFKEWKNMGFRDNGDEIVKPVFERVNVPTYFYKIDMPPCGGVSLTINGTPMYHGATYELDIDTLRTVKDIVYRTWKHDADIHGTDENFYRAPSRRRLSMRGV